MDGGNSNEQFSLVYDEEKLRNDIITHFPIDFYASMDYYQSSIEPNVSDLEATNIILKLACKITYIDRILATFGQSSISNIFEKIREQCVNRTRMPFANKEDLGNFIKSMWPFFIYIPNQLNPKNTCHGFRLLAQNIANKLRDDSVINEEDILEMITNDLVPSRTSQKFKNDEIFIDFQGIKKFAAQSDFFSYDKLRQVIRLTSSGKTALSLFLPILIPKIDFGINRVDFSRTTTLNAVVVKSLTYTQKARIIGANPLSDYVANIPSMFRGQVEKTKFTGFEEPTKTYVTVFGSITSNADCQMHVIRIRESLIGKSASPPLSVSWLWGRRDDAGLVYNVAENASDNIFQVPEAENRDQIIQRLQEIDRAIGEPDDFLPSPTISEVLGSIYEHRAECAECLEHFKHFYDISRNGCITLPAKSQQIVVNVILHLLAENPRGIDIENMFLRILIEPNWQTINMKEMVADGISFQILLEEIRCVTSFVENGRKKYMLKQPFIFYPRN